MKIVLQKRPPMKSNGWNMTPRLRQSIYDEHAVWRYIVRPSRFRVMLKQCIKENS